jgi:hypothetical protein
MMTDESKVFLAVIGIIAWWGLVACASTYFEYRMNVKAIKELNNDR